MQTLNVSVNRELVRISFVWQKSERAQTWNNLRLYILFTGITNTPKSHLATLDPLQVKIQNIEYCDNPFNDFLFKDVDMVSYRDNAANFSI